VYARDVAGRSAETDYETFFYRIVAARKHDRDRGGCGLGGESRRRPASHNDGHLVVDQIGDQICQSIVLTVCPAGLDNNVLTFDKTGFVEALAVCGHEGCLRLG
jgi:hypothetical protein